MNCERWRVQRNENKVLNATESGPRELKRTAGSATQILHPAGQVTSSSLKGLTGNGHLRNQSVFIETGRSAQLKFE